MTALFQSIIAFFKDDSSNSSMRVMVVFVVLSTTITWIVICLHSWEIKGAGDLVAVHASAYGAKLWQKSQEIKAQQGPNPSTPSPVNQ